jgi:hypothetical protein
MKMSRKLVTILFVFMAIFITATSALAAEEVKVAGDLSLVEDVKEAYVVTLEDGSTKKEISVATVTFNGKAQTVTKNTDNATFTITPATADITESGKFRILKVELTNKSGAKTSKEFNVTVKPAVELSNVKVNGKVYGTTSHSAKPNEKVKFEVDVKNNLPESLTDVELVFTSASITLGDISKFKTVNKVNIKGGKTTTLMFEEVLNLKAKEALHDGTLTVTGLDLRQSKDATTVKKSAKKDIKLNVIQDFADVVITTATLSSKELVCANDVSVSTKLKNKGDTKEDDVIVQAYVSGKKVAESGKQTIEANAESLAIELKVPTKGLKHGTNDITLKLWYRNGEKTPSHGTPLTVTNKPCLTSASPKETTITRLKAEPSKDFTVTTAVEGQTVDWMIKKDGQALDSITQVVYPFKWTESGVYTVTAVVNGDAKESKSWTVTVLGKPKTSFKTNLKDNQDLSFVKDLSIEDTKSGSKIVFNDPVDLSLISDLDKFVSIGSNFVAIDSKNAPGLGMGKTAKVVLGSKISNPLILKSNDFKTGTLNEADFSTCVDCVVDAKASTTTFTVSGFSTYLVKEQKPADLSVSTVSFPVGKAGDKITAEFTVKNTGTVEDLIVVGINHAIPASYSPLVDVPAFSLKHGAEQKVKLSVTIPSSAKAGESFNLGDLSVSTFDKTGKEIVKKQSLSLNLESFLSIEKIEIEGSTSGDLKIDGDNEIEVWVKNKFSKDLEDVLITVRVLDGSGDELAEEEAREFDLDSGDEDSEKVDIDISGEDLEDDSYTIEVTVEGEDKDGNDHTVTKTIDVDLDIEKHDLIVNSVVASQTSLSCSRQASLYVTVENKGKEDEKDVEIRVSNPTLGVDASKKDLRIDKFSDKDNSYRATFGLDFQNAKEGSYTLTAEVLRNGKSQDTKDISIAVKDCGTTSTTTASSTTLGSDSAIVKQLQQQLQALQGQAVATPQSTVNTSFRDSNTYLLLLGALTILIFIAAILAIVVGAARKR